MLHLCKKIMCSENYDGASGIQVGGPTAPKIPMPTGPSKADMLRWCSALEHVSPASLGLPAKVDFVRESQLGKDMLHCYLMVKTSSLSNAGVDHAGVHERITKQLAALKSLSLESQNVGDAKAGSILSIAKRELASAVKLQEALSNAEVSELVEGDRVAAAFAGLCPIPTSLPATRWLTLAREFLTEAADSLADDGWGRIGLDRAPINLGACWCPAAIIALLGRLAASAQSCDVEDVQMYVVSKPVENLPTMTLKRCVFVGGKWSGSGLVSIGFICCSFDCNATCAGTIRFRV